MITALITSKNNPKVKIVAGSVNKTKSGFTKILSNPNTKATSNADPQPSTLTPGSRCDNNKTKTVVKKMFISVLMLKKFIADINIKKAPIKCGAFKKMLSLT